MFENSRLSRYKKIEGEKIIIETAKKGEKFVTLDDAERTLSSGIQNGIFPNFFRLFSILERVFQFYFFDHKFCPAASLS